MLGSVAVDILDGDISGLETASGRHGGHSSLVHLAYSTFVLYFPVFLFELDSKETNWTGLFGRQANLCANSLWQLEQIGRAHV